MVCPPDTIRSTPQIPEGGSQPFPGTHGQKAVLLLRRSVGRLLHALQLLLHLVQVVGALSLAPGGHGFILGAHILNFCQLQGAVFLRLGQGRTGDVRVYMDLERIVVFADDQAIADGAEISPQRPQWRIFAHLRTMNTVSKVKVISSSLRAEKSALLSAFSSLTSGILLTPQGPQHTVQYYQISLSAGVHHPGLFQHRVHFDGLVQGLQTLADGLLQDIFHAVALFGGLGGLGRQPDGRLSAPCPLRASSQRYRRWPRPPSERRRAAHHRPPHRP